VDIKKEIIESRYTEIKLSLDFLWMFIAIAILFGLEGKLWILVILILAGWFVNFAVKRYLKGRE